MNQPYQAPKADVSMAGSQETYQPKFLSLSGRIGRMRYFVYAAGLTLLFYLVMGIAAALVIPGIMSAGQSAIGVGAVIIGLIVMVGFIALMVMSWGYMVRRLNDINASGWLSLLMLVPIANLVLGLVMLFKRGSEGRNQYGAAPVSNSGGVKAAFVIVLLLMVGYFGVLFPITMANYANYSQQAMQQIDYSEY
ncbi:MAG: cell division protein FtsK [Alcanivorax borkumensis]|jgi:uncharacterized membrane protein YhaH (DUF805 family)|uniref:Cell division protein FtsK n=1 Tax=Alcanivorax borkumensis (strain ATCC 700651 / DSM 11573 / NCIMB 13689 / SK2) TaxID=393595 RepID=Q0VQ53_ALCBS|nr:MULTISPECIES: DUF805 domain-containing protein [Alcanivorax]OJH07846.1 MAG: cell division protein FtsK [Alcanivorax borkumensis]BAP14170.1 DNA translocase FtsK [Alcanivorax sp. NBRC 101098]CAL16695.1 cell division protein FtsK [Alcanivorax borkumensis SK2]